MTPLNFVLRISLIRWASC